MTSNGNAADGLELKDRKTGLVVFGILQIILGAFCALMVPLMLIGLLASATLAKGAAPPVEARMTVPSVLFYLGLAGWFIWVGIGSVKARRWARAVVLVSSWLWLIGGVLGLVFMLLFLPDMYEQMSKAGQMPPGMVAIVRFITLGFTVVFYVAVPGALVLFYGSRHVKATVDRLDAQVRWTDRCPLPVLGMSLVSAFGAVSLPLLGFYGWALPFFGVIVTGWAGATAVLVSMMLLVYIAWGSYRLRIASWWCAGALVVTWSASSMITFSRTSLMAFYEKMDFPAPQLELMKTVMPGMEPWMIPTIGCWTLLLLAYLLYTRRFFGRA